ncbi:endonuclease/exonuclease/phosphatase family protein [Cellulomonas fimi]|uniref:endonuclease/exonuclease/phosphatase family protein n=1 Tax=Cellulomonas fimi TaxID=1708 RepID=UPI00234DBA5B|nr:endonuclease/exonuclease/phosphatase family protein [Cellulomonas fimi]MDC7120936.1 endonuclease/exonuclease/phosphatase family protein [Cellulomonas fimi]
MSPTSDAPPDFYGALIESTVRVVTWNVWGRYGDWEAREAAVVATLAGARPDVVVLAESWATATDSQCARLAGPLGLPHHTFSGVPAQEDDAALSGVAVLSRWPMTRRASRTCGAARVEEVELSGPRGPLQVCGVVLDAWWLDESAARQAAVRDLLTHLARTADESVPLVVCGDFNCDADSDEIRMLTGRTAVPVPGLSFYDAWEVAGARDGPDPSGATWSNANPHAATLLWPDRRIDYVFSATRRRGGAGHPVRARLLGTDPVAGTYPSDHRAVQADLRY